MKQECIREVRYRWIQPTLLWGGLIIILLIGKSCSPEGPQQATYVPVEQLEPTFGRLISVANSPTPNQNGTGDLIGLFEDDRGTFWGIPLSVDSDGMVLGCAPPMLRNASVSGVVPADAVEIVGTANQPTGWRGGTGKLGLLVRDAEGNLRWHLVASVEVTNGPLCWSRSEPVQILEHYRLVKAPTEQTTR